MEEFTKLCNIIKLTQYKSETTSTVNRLQQKSTSTFQRWEILAEKALCYRGFLSQVQSKPS